MLWTHLWLTGYDSLSTIKGRDLGIHRLGDNMDITDWNLPDKSHVVQRQRTGYNGKKVVPTGLEDETWLSVSSKVFDWK